MEPISLIITALIAGATAAVKDTASAAIKDSYSGLKALIKAKLAGDTLAQAMVEASPDEIEQAEALLKTKITAAEIDQDKEILEKAAEVMKNQDPKGFEEGKYTTTVSVQGDVIGVAGTNTGTVNIGPINRLNQN